MKTKTVKGDFITDGDIIVAGNVTGMDIIGFCNQTSKIGKPTYINGNLVATGRVMAGGNIVAFATLPESKLVSAMMWVPRAIFSAIVKFLESCTVPNNTKGKYNK